MPPPARVVEHLARQYRATWRGTAVFSAINPVLFLAAMGLGLGSLVDRGAGSASIGDIGYLGFVAPGLLAATAMQTAAADSSYPVMGGIKWTRIYHAMLASPLTVRDIVAGYVSFLGLRLLVTSTVFLVVMVLFGAVESPLAVLAVPAAALCGLAFATPIMAVAAASETDGVFNLLFRFGIMPLFLFSGTFFPTSQLPAVVQWLAVATPLWHGVELCRHLSTGDLHAIADAVHVAVLLAVVAAGARLAEITFSRRLVP